jgi:hypothetical protein
MTAKAQVILLYGRSGLGKTYACSQLTKNPACGDIYFMDFDGGLQTVTGPDGKLPDRIHASPYLAKEDECQRLWEDVRVRKNVPAEVQTVVLDSLTALEELFVAKLRGHSNPHAQGEMSFPKWGKRNGLLMDYVRLAKSWPYKYVIFTAHQETERDEGGKAKAIVPFVGGEKTHEKFMGMCDHVLQMHITMDRSRQLILNNTGLTMAKCRSGALSAQYPDGVCTKQLHEIIHLL